MYWRVRKISPEQVAKTYGVHAVCVVSILFNLILLTKIAPSNALNAQQKADFAAFSQQVTRHMLDTTYTTYESSMRQLQTELNPQLFRSMQKPDAGGATIIPPSSTDMKAIAKTLDGSKSVSSVMFSEIKVAEEPDANVNNFVPVTVTGKIISHSSEGLVGPQDFRFKFWMGQTKDLKPLVGAFQDQTSTISQSQPAQ